MTERPILMSGAMVRAILAGDKTQTRRAVRPQPFWHDIGTGQPTQGSVDGYLRPCPYGAPGDRLWVRETFHPGETLTLYRATDGDAAILDDSHWRPSIFMPRSRSRITLAIESVRVERVQAISDADIAAEGVTAEAVESLWEGATRKQRWAALPGFNEPGVTFRTQPPRALWQLGWTLINGRASWDANPWVWAIDFRRVTP